MDKSRLWEQQGAAGSSSSYPGAGRGCAGARGGCEGAAPYWDLWIQLHPPAQRGCEPFLGRGLSLSGSCTGQCFTAGWSSRAGTGVGWWEDARSSWEEAQGSPGRDPELQKSSPSQHSPWLSRAQGGAAVEAPCCGRISATPAEFSRQVRQSLPWGEAVQGCWHTWDGAGSGDTAGALIAGAGHPRCAPRRWVNPPRSMGRTSKPAPLRTPDCSHLSHPIPSEAAGGVGTSRAGAGRWWESRGGGREPISPAR